MADSKISALAALTSLADTDELAVASGGASKKVTVSNLRKSVLTQSEATLGGNVTMVNANTFYDGPSLSLAAATWLILWKALITVNSSGSQTYAFSVKLWDGTTIYDEMEVDAPIAANLSGWNFPVSGFAVAVLGSPATLKISAAGIRASSASQISRDINTNSGTSHTATRLDAIRIA